MNRTQLLTFELGSACNLGGVHGACPNRHPERYAHLDTSRTLDDATIIRIVEEMHQRHGFAGLIAWHYYNEPLLSANRMFPLMEAIRERVPQSRFLLWTNGTLIPHDEPRLAMFEQVHLSDYTAHRYPPQNVHVIQAAGCKLTVYRGHLDARLEITGDDRGGAPCHRPFVEFIVDNHGNVHLCCYDWKGMASPGNVFTTPLSLLVERWKAIRSQLARPRMDDDAPEVCRRCKMGSPYLPRFDHSAAEQADVHIVAGCPEVRTRRRIAVVFVSYRLPQKRLADHFAWNDARYREANARVYVVTDKQYDVPDYAECVIFRANRLPKLNGKRVFSLTKTKNAGVRKAIVDKAEIIVCSDVDVAFADQAWNATFAITDKTASAPLYLMAQNYPGRETANHPDHGATGTVTMTAANWSRISYDERCVGYGADDGLILAACKRGGLTIDRTGYVYHIAHDADAPQKNIPGKGRGDCWNRDNGFNPDNFKANQKLMAR